MYFFLLIRLYFSFFFFNDTATTEIYTLSLHDALPISARRAHSPRRFSCAPCSPRSRRWPISLAQVCLPSWSDRKSTRLNSSHGYISYAVFCLKKKKTLRPLVIAPLCQTLTDHRRELTL